MNQTPPEVAIVNLVFIAFWLLLVIVIWIAAFKSQRIRAFKEQMTAQWKLALVITAIFLFGMGLSGRGWFNLYGIAIFCEALIGLTIARQIDGFEPLPVVDAVARRKRIWQNIGLSLGIAVLAVIPAIAIGTVGLDIGQQIFGETNLTHQASNMFPPDKISAFFMFLAGAGIAEETLYRLVLLSLFWHWTKRPWVAILLSSMVFGLYHLTPLSSMYKVFLQFPVSQFLASTFIGIVWGFLYKKRGFETAVVAHTLSNWLPLLVFAQ